jgi:chromosome partitioning protein
LLIDPDPQGTVMRWSSIKTDGTRPLNIVAMASAILHREVPKLSRKYDYVIIDCPPGGPTGTDNVTRSALLCVKLVIVPFQPSAFDLWSAEGMAELIERARELNTSLEARLLVSRRIGNTALGRDAHQVAGRFGLAVLDTQIHQRIILAQSGLAGETISDFAPKSAAAKEFDSLTKEVLTCLGK